MEELVILGTDGRPANGRKYDRNSILLGKADGAYMDCTRESVEALQAEKAEKLREYRKEHGLGCIASDLIPIVLAGFNNPYDEIHNLLLQAYNNTRAANYLLQSTERQRMETDKLCQELRTEQTAKDIACEFITSRGYTEEFRKFCEEQAGRTPSGTAPQYEVRQFIQ